MKIYLSYAPFRPREHAIRTPNVIVRFLALEFALKNIENGSSAVVVTSAQKDSLTFSGSGAVYTDVNGVLQGTDGDDSFTGDGTDQFKPGAGDDTVSRVDTVLYDGNYTNFTIDRDSDNLDQLSVEHSGGNSSQGTDTVSSVLNLSFSDGPPYVVDDHHPLIKCSPTYLLSLRFHTDTYLYLKCVCYTLKLFD